jgi:FixJ family two-component response regulator
MDPREDDVRATAEQLARDGRELASIEQAKAQADPRTGRFRRLTNRAERLVTRIVRLGRVQRQIADEIAEDPRP